MGNVILLLAIIVMPIAFFAATGGHDDYGDY